MTLTEIVNGTEEERSNVIKFPIRKNVQEVNYEPATAITGIEAKIDEESKGGIAYHITRGVMLTAVGSGLLVASLGALAAGVYEGSTQQGIFDRIPSYLSGIDRMCYSTTALRLMGIGYVAQVARKCIPNKDNKKWDELTNMEIFEKHEGCMLNVIIPVVPIVSMICYSVGYGIGKLNQ